MGNPPHALYACGAEGLVLGWTLATNPDMRRKLLGMRLTGEISVENMRILENLAMEAGIQPDKPSWYGRYTRLPAQIPQESRILEALPTPTPDAQEAVPQDAALNPRVG